MKYTLSSTNLAIAVILPLWVYLAAKLVLSSDPSATQVNLLLVITYPFLAALFGKTIGSWPLSLFRTRIDSMLPCIVPGPSEDAGQRCTAKNIYGVLGMPKIVETNLKFVRPLSNRTKTDYIVLHHAAASRCTVEDVHRWHLERGWAGFGYHFLIRKDGTIYRGRPVHTVGTHVANQNGNTIGICAEGNYENEQMPPAQQQALTELVAYLKQVYPQAKVVGHRNLSASACPGKNFPLNQIASAVTQKEGTSAVFKDVSDNHWAKSSIEKVAGLGLIVGDGRGNFNPNENVTRAQLAVIIDRLLKLIGK